MRLDTMEFCPFPKHRGKPWAEVIEEDQQYVEWLISGDGPELSPMLEERLTNLLEGDEDDE